MSPCFYSFLCPSAWTASVCKTNPTVVPHASVLPLPLETCLTAWSCYKSSPRAWFIYCHEQKDLKKKIFSNKENSCWHKENFCTLDFCTRSTASRFLIITLDYFEKEKLYPGNSGKGQGLFSTWQVRTTSAIHQPKVNYWLTAQQTPSVFLYLHSHVHRVL